jgi:hypothetical protein
MRREFLMATGKSQQQSSGGSALGFEATLWATADQVAHYKMMMGDTYVDVPAVAPLVEARA